MIRLKPEFAAQLPRPWRRVNDVFKVQGRIYREPEGANRRTLRFELQGQGYFLKLHWGVGWKEILKNLGSGRWPVLGASNEWRAIMRLQQLGISTMQLMAWGREGWNPAKQRSFVVTKELTDTVSLEDYCAHWRLHPPAFREKYLLLEHVAIMSRHLHQHGINHRDLYICHFLLSQPWPDKTSDDLKLFLIDLHRVQLRRKTPRRWLVKDLGSLYFSVMDIGLTQHDLLRFLKIYFDLPLRQIMRQHHSLLQAINQRAQALQQKGNQG